MGCVGSKEMVCKCPAQVFTLIVSIVWNLYSTQWGLAPISQAGSTASLALLGECRHLKVIFCGYRAGLSIWDFNPEGINMGGHICQGLCSCYRIICPATRPESTEQRPLEVSDRADWRAFSTREASGQTCFPKTWAGENCPSRLEGLGGLPCEWLCSLQQVLLRWGRREGGIRDNGPELLMPSQLLN